MNQNDQRHEAIATDRPAIVPTTQRSSVAEDTARRTRKAMEEYVAKNSAVAVRTARLRTLRLAKEAESQVDKDTGRTKKARSAVAKREDAAR